MSSYADGAEILFGQLAVQGRLPSVIVAPQTGAIVWANQAARSLDLPDQFPVDLLEAQRLRALEPGATYSGRFQWPTISGALLHTIVHACGVDWHGDRLIAIQFVDVSDEGRRLADLELRERRLHALMSANFDAYFEWNLQSGRVAFTGQIHELLGMPEHTSLWTLSEWLEMVIPEERAALLQAAQTAIETKSYYQHEYSMLRGDGRTIRVAETGVALPGPTGAVELIVGFDRDVSKERAAEEALRDAAELYGTLFKKTANPLFHIAEDGSYLDANEAAVSFLDTDREELVQLHAADHFPQVWEALMSDGAEAMGTYELAIEVGTQRKQLLLSLVPCHVSEVETYFALGTDVTTIRGLAEALARSEEALREHARSLEDRTTALRVIMEQREADRLELRRNVQSNMEMLINPLIDRLCHSLSMRPELAHLEALRETLGAIVHPFVPAADTERPVAERLTSRELEILNLILSGMTSAQIADSLYISPATVASHRASLRKKLGPELKGRRLSRHMASLALSGG